MSRDAKAARKELEVGEHNVNATVKLQGTLTVAEDQEIAPTASLLNLEFLSLVLHHAGVTREAAAKAIEEVAGEYLVDWTGSKEDKKAAKAARKERVAAIDPEGKFKAVVDSFKEKLPKVPRAGKVVFKGEVVEVGTPLRVVEDDETEAKAS